MRTRRRRLATRRTGITALVGIVTAVAAIAVAPGSAATTTTILKVWGDNCCGQLGIGQHNNFKLVPAANGLTGVKQVAGGGVYSLALMDNGTIMAWGDNFAGQLGDGTTTQRNSPVQVKGITNAVQVSTFAFTSLALLSDGSVMAWGDGLSGELGNGSSTSSSVPVKVQGLTGVKQVVAGQNYSLALLKDGTVMAWGDNSVGELGIGSSGNHTTLPVRVKGLSGVTALAAGTQHALAVLNTGAVMARGSNVAGDLGTGEHGAAQSDVPVRVDIITNAVGVAAGFDHSAAVLADGTVMSWGSNEFGQLGIATRGFLGSDDPIQVFGIHNAAAVSAQDFGTLALLKDGTMMGWGDDSNGALGDGQNNPEVPAPVAVKGLVGVTQMSAGGSFGLALVP